MLKTKKKNEELSKTKTLVQKKNKTKNIQQEGQSEEVHLSAGERMEEPFYSNRGIKTVTFINLSRKQKPPKKNKAKFDSCLLRQMGLY